MKRALFPAAPGILLALAPALALAACATPAMVERSDGLAMIGQTTRVGADKVRVDSLIEDSRCPMNARCVWAGRVIVEATVERGGAFDTKRFTLGEPSDGLVLDTVEPGRMAGKKMKPADYQFHFSIAQ
ncbi:MAG: hypothetical protein ACOVKV_10580 [Novosphingobium sp.]